MIVLTIAIILSSLLLLYNKWKHSYWLRLGVVSPKPTPFVGHIGEVILARKHNGDVFGKIYSEYSGEAYVGVYALHHPVILIRDPGLIKAILAEDFNHFHDNDFDFEEKLDPLFAQNAIAQKGDKWKKARSEMTPAFTTAKIKSMLPIIIKSCEKLVKHLDTFANDTSIPEDGFEIKTVTVKYTLDVVAACAFGLDAETFTNPKSHFLEMCNRIIDTGILNVIRFYLVIVVPVFQRFLKIRFIDSKVSNWMIRIIKDSVQYRKVNNIQKQDFLQNLINLRNKEGNELSEAAIAGHSFSFLSDGFQTSSATLAFACYEVGKNKNVQDQLREEINTILDNHDGIWTYEALQQMHYLERVIYESLRKYPISLLMQKRCTKAYTLPGKNDESPGVQIKVGDSVVIPIFGIHRDPAYYPNPEIFDPDRFTEETKSTRSRYTFLGFGEGARHCLGFRFGLAITKLALAFIVMNYNIKATAKTKEPIQIDPRSLLLLPKGGLWVKLEKKL